MNDSTQSGDASGTPAPWRILLVDDDLTHQLFIRRLLERAGFEVDTARNGEEALAKINAYDFRLVLSDWEMPIMDGITLCRALRSSQTKGYIYTILLTARDDTKNIVTGLESGADDYLTKPVAESELIARLNTGKRIVTLERSLRSANEENRLLSVTDPLTGAYNRRYLMNQLPREIERSRRYRRPLSVVMCDVDYFKKINDTYGHSVGDEVLRWFVARLRESLRASDWVVRYGGDEFVVVLPETTVANAAVAAEHLRVRVSSAISISGASFTLSASFGGAGWTAIPEVVTLDGLIDKCDACVYRSKVAGRNRISTESMDEAAG